MPWDLLIFADYEIKLIYEIKYFSIALLILDKMCFDRSTQMKHLKDILGELMSNAMYNIRLMVKGLFHRATKIERTKKDKDKLKKKKKDEEIEDDKVVIG